MSRRNRIARAVMPLGAFFLCAGPIARAQSAGTAGLDKGNQVPVDKMEEMSLAVGENRTIYVADVKNYSEGTPGIVDVKVTPDGTQFVVVGQKPGSTTLLLIKKDGTRQNWSLNVFNRSPDAVQRELTTLLQGYVGLRVRRVGARFFIEGGVGVEADQRKIQHIAQLYTGQVESLVEVGSPSADRQLNIRIDFYFVQFDKNAGYAVGIGWPGRVGGDGIFQSQLTYDFIAKSMSTATATITNQPLPFLDASANHGWAKVLRQATIITGNGSEAKFNSGGEQNFQIAANLTTNIRPIEFGVDLTVLPRFDRSTQEMEVKVDANVSDLTPPASSTPLPGRNTTKVATLVHLKLGQSIVLSGISARAVRHQVSGIPILSEIPVLGLLFGSHSNQETEVEGTVFVIPSVIDSLPRASLDMIRAAAHEYDRYSGDLRSVAPYDKNPPAASQP
jgi:pilus assembly protein CpaC